MPQNSVKPFMDGPYFRTDFFFFTNYIFLFSHEILLYIFIRWKHARTQTKCSFFKLNIHFVSL